MQNEIMNMQQPWLMQTSKESRRKSLDMHGNQRNYNLAGELMQSTHSEPIPSPTLSNRENWSPSLSSHSTFSRQQNPLANSTASENGSEQGHLSYNLPDGTVKPAWRSRRNSSKGNTLTRSASRRTKSVDAAHQYQQDDVRSHFASFVACTKSAVDFRYRDKKQSRTNSRRLAHCHKTNTYKRSS